MMLIEDWRHSWRLWSVRASAIGAAVFAAMLAMPGEIAAIWQAMPPELLAFIPNAPQIGLVIMATVAVSRVLRQATPVSPAPVAPLGLLSAATSAPVPAWRHAALATCRRAITTIAVHCAATPAGREVTAAEVRGWHKAQGWSDIGYHFFIRLDGTIEPGRAIDQAGAHVAGYNARSIGVCYAGGVKADGKTPADTRTPAQKAALLSLLILLKGRWPRATIQGHRDYPNVAKACPSFDAKAEYAGIGR